MRISFYFFFLILLIFFGCSKTDSDTVEKNSFHDSTPINLLDESVRNSLAKKAIYFDDLSWSEEENEKAFLSGKLFTGWVKREKETLLGIAQMKDGLEKPKPSVPESFLAILRELNALGLDFSMRKFENGFNSTTKIHDVERDIFIE